MAIPPSAFHQGQNQAISKEKIMTTEAKLGSFPTCNINQLWVTMLPYLWLGQQAYACQRLSLTGQAHQCKMPMKKIKWFNIFLS